jgi:hypothetical protein
VLGAHSPLDERSRFVRLVAELVRHVVQQDRTLAGVDHALAIVCERGVDLYSLIEAAQAMDAAASERAVAASLCALLDHMLGEPEARRAVADVIAKLDAQDAAEVGTDLLSQVATDLLSQVALVVRMAGKRQARRVLGDALYYELVPQAELYEV